jgi:RNA polymerase sigma-70 factor (ECF subfamily)
MIGGERTDRELVDAVLKSGDEQAFRMLYRRHTPKLYRVAVQLTEDRGGVAEDVVHDAWIRAAARFETFEWRSSLSTWLTGFLINRVRELRRDWAREGAEATEGAAEAVTPVVHLDDRLDLRQAITALPDGYRAAIVLHDVEGYTHDDVASLLSIDVGTSRSQLARARRSLRRWLEPEGKPA